MVQQSACYHFRAMASHRLSTMDYRLWTMAYRVVTFCGVLLAVAGAAAQTSDRARTEAQARRATERLQSLQREADALATQERTLLTDLRRHEVERNLKNELVKQSVADADQVARELGTIG